MAGCGRARCSWTSWRACRDRSRAPGWPTPATRRSPLAAALSRTRVDEQLGDAAARLLGSLDAAGAVDGAGLADARARLPATLRGRCEPTWTSLRDLVLREWPDAHPLGAL